MGRESVRNDIQGGHGAIGKIISINLPTIVIANRDNIEKIILIQNNTAIRSFGDIATTTNLKIDDYIIVLGYPDNKGEVVAKLIRIIPSPPEEFMTKTTSTSSPTILNQNSK